ncbi:MAG: FAD-dependent thymidylate synthase [Abitibacteriaceae bacterium]|nr:FAD-dependent thymidylate synthase [Abditibacteriaceae bacterium]MBV9865055.1 FAD-dependent thymidylate synthase [Abditibacteriaceae bacterium]
MKVTQVALCPTEASTAAGRPALTPELLAASGARYSRNNEGLESILAKIDPNNLDKSVDSIFRMIDYGHQSIADMAPVAMFIDGISMWLAYHVWTLCPTAGGQESSTRYIKLSPESLIAPTQLGIAENAQAEWHRLMQECFAAYSHALEYWEAIAAQHPEVARIPRSLLDDPSEKAARQVARMQRNYGFDRARNFLPVAVATNMMLIMSARAWVQLCQHLLSHPLSEAKTLGEALRHELELCAPRMLKHATAKDSMQNGIEADLEALRQTARRGTFTYLQENASPYECPPTPQLQVMLPAGIKEEALAHDLIFHDNRYAWIGESLKRTAVRFGWEAVAFAEIRDLNRHRTGTKHCPFIPVGFYSALDQVPQDLMNSMTTHLPDYLATLSLTGKRISVTAHEHLIEGDYSYVYWTLLGTQYAFEHVTTADKFIYEAELRTGTGAHFRYAKHLHDALSLWYEKFPATRGLILEGSAEPE